MNRLLPSLVCVLCLLLGVSIGWYLSYTRPVAKHQRELLRQYQYLRDNFHMTDEQMAKAGPKVSQYFEDMKRQDEMAAKVSFAAFIYLERGSIDQARSRLLPQ